MFFQKCAGNDGSKHGRAAGGGYTALSVQTQRRVNNQAATTKCFGCGGRLWWRDGDDIIRHRRKGVANSHAGPQERGRSERGLIDTEETIPDVSQR